MSEPLHRTQILLRQEQHEELRELAARQGTSLSQLVRSFVDEKLDQRRQQAEARIEQRLQSLARIEQHCREALRRRDGEPLDVDVSAVIREIREERDDEILDRLTAGGD